MVRSIEASGKTVEEAMQLAAEELGVAVEQIRFEILEEPSKGFLGIAHTPARVKATVVSEGEEAVSMPESVEAEGESEMNEMEEYGEITSIGEEMVDLLEQIFEAMGAGATAQVKQVTDEEITIDIEGKDVAVLIGRGGQTLDALQYLIGIAANRKHDRKLRVVLDAEGYRQRHADMLTARAMDYARHVKQTGEEAVFDPMPARDRRIIHMALKDDPDVYTYSEGEGPGRYIVISPRKEGEEEVTSSE